MVKTITFSAPRIKRYETDEFQPSGEPRYIAVSLKGNACDLMCDHCNGRMLTALHRADTPDGFLRLCENMHARGCRAMLLTGGCAPDGTIPLPAFVDAICAARERWGYRFAAHTKLVTEDFAKAAFRAGIDPLMTDVLGDEDALHDVYHLFDHTLDDIVRSLDYAEQYGLRLAPHIMIGLSYGKVVGEHRALEMLKGRKLASLAIVVLTPLMRTPMSHIKIDPFGVLEIMEAARRKFPDIRLTLGCAKTGGQMQRQFEERALELGYDAIAYPSEGIIARARELGYEVNLSETCCVLEEMNC